MQLHQGYCLSVRERGTTEGDTTAMEAYVWGILPLIKSLLWSINLNEINSKEVVFWIDFSDTGSLKSFKDYWDKLIAIDSKYGYFPEPTKSYLIVKVKNW